MPLLLRFRKRLQRCFARHFDSTRSNDVDFTAVALDGMTQWLVDLVANKSDPSFGSTIRCHNMRRGNFDISNCLR